MKKVVIGNCTLYHGDSYEVLKEIESDSVTLIHTDPPYIIHSETSTMNSNGSTVVRGFLEKVTEVRGFWDKDADVRGFWDKVADVDIIDGFNYSIFEEWERVLKCPNYQIWCSKKQFPDFLNMAIKNGWSWQDIMLYRNNPIPVTNGKYLDKDYGIHMWSGRKITGGFKDKQTDYHWNIGGHKEWNHPTMKPLKPTEHLIRVGSSEGDLVLDPFMGSCTTGEACVRNNRRFIGIERNDTFFQMSCERIEKVNSECKNVIPLF